MVIWMTLVFMKTIIKLLYLFLKLKFLKKIEAIKFVSCAVTIIGEARKENFSLLNISIPLFFV